MHNLKNYIKFIFFVFLIIYFGGCDSTVGPEGPEGPVGPKLTGDLVGFVNLVDIEGNVLTDKSGVIVRVEGSSISDTTNSNGRWVLSGLTTGTYTLSLTKNKYSTYKTTYYQFVGGGQAYFGSTSLYELPSFRISPLYASVSDLSINVSGTLSGSLPNSSRYIVVFCGSSPNITSNPKDYLKSSTISISNTSTSFNVTSLFSKSTLNNLGFWSGSVVYLVAYSSSNVYGVNLTYLDLETGRYFYAGLGDTPSNIVSVAIP